MSTTHTTTMRNAIADFVVDQIDGSDPGNLVFRLTGSAGSPGTAVATLTFSNPAFGAASSGTATANSITQDTNATGNASAVAAATLQDADGVVIAHCAVGASGSDINMTGGLTIGAGDTVSCSSLTYSAPA